MIIQGKFNNIDNKKTFFVKIGDTGAIKTIQDNTDDTESENIVCFGSDPVTISSDNSDTFTNIYFRQATINLTANFDIRPYVVATNYTNLPVEIRLYDSQYPNTESSWPIIFKGYVQPMSFDQPFMQTWNEFSLTAIDMLGVSQYVDYAKIEAVDLEDLGYVEARQIMEDIIDELGLTTDANTFDISNDYTETTKVNQSIFIGSSPDDYKKCSEVLDLLGRIYGFWIWQDGDTIRVRNIFTMAKHNNYVTMEDYAGSDFNLSIMEGYNQIKLSCALEDAENDLFDLFNSETTSSSFANREKYLTEYICPGEGNNAFSAFKNLLYEHEPADYKDKPRYYDHYLWIKKSDVLDFGANGYYNKETGLYNAINDSETYTTVAGNETPSKQYQVLKWIAANPGSAGLISFGHTENLFNPQSSANIAAPSMKDYLLIRIDGHDDVGENGHINTIISNIRAHSPIFTYEYPTVQNFIPADNDTTNYFVISAGINLQPIQLKTGPTGNGQNNGWPDDTDSSQYHDNSRYRKSQNTVQDCLDNFKQTWNGIYGYGTLLWHHTVPHQDNGDGAYYAQRYWKSEGTRNRKVDNYLWTFGPLQQNDKNKDLKYAYSSPGNTTDKLTKMPILCAQLKIGEGEDAKYCVEYMCEGGRYETVNNVRRKVSDGINEFVWRKLSECLTDEDGSPINYFTIGIDPNIDDHIIGQDYQNISSNQTIEMNLNEKGMAIPIKVSDHLIGKLHFELLGPYNAVYDYVTKGTKSWWKFWKKTPWNTNQVPILEKLENILISDLKIKLTTDNGGYKNGVGGKDLVYSTINTGRLINDKEYETSLCSCLTSEEANELGVDWSMNNSAIIDENDEPFYNIEYEEGGETLEIKLEELRVNEQYSLWNKARTVTKATYKIDWTNCHPSKTVLPETFEFNYLDDLMFWPIGREIDLKYDTDMITMVDISTDE